MNIKIHFASCSLISVLALSLGIRPWGPDWYVIPGIYVLGFFVDADHVWAYWRSPYGSFETNIGKIYEYYRRRAWVPWDLVLHRRLTILSLTLIMTILSILESKALFFIESSYLLHVSLDGVNGRFLGRRFD
jgi:hypothetical protein